MNFFNEYESLITCLFSFSSLIIVIIGWYVANKNATILSTKNFKNQLSLENKIQKTRLSQESLEWEIKYINNQISQLYGPILFKLKELESIRLHIQEEMGTGDEPIFPGSRTLADLSLENQKIWIHFIDNYQIPILKEILKIMFENSHLLINEKEPCIYEFKEYTIGHALLNKQFHDHIPNFYDYSYSINLPQNYNIYIEKH